jgi:lipid-A-disaccharide synthase
MNHEVMIIAGEASGDLHGARLVRSMCAIEPSLQFSGVGGPELQKAGVDLLFDAARISVVGLFEVLTHLRDILAARRAIIQRLAASRPSLLILIDFPDFNLSLAKHAQKLGIPVFYYISPQVWAWRSGRVKTIGRLVKKIGVILPFEEDFYRDRGVEAHYVGHPLLDSVTVNKDRQQFCAEQGIDPNKKLVGIVPGSRVKEVERLLPVFLDAAKQFTAHLPGSPTFLIPLAPTLSESEIRQSGLIPFENDLDIRIIKDQRYDLMAACDLVIAASGTVTLELLLLNTPMVVAYKLSPLSYFFGRFIVKGDYFSLVNLIGNRPIVPELLQDDANPARISAEMERLLFDEQAGRDMAAGFDEVRGLLGRPGASQRAAELAMSVIGQSGVKKDG